MSDHKNSPVSYMQKYIHAISQKNSHSLFYKRLTLMFRYREGFSAVFLKNIF